MKKAYKALATLRRLLNDHPGAELELEAFNALKLAVSQAKDGVEEKLETLQCAKVYHEYNQALKAVNITITSIIGVLTSMDNTRQAAKTRSTDMKKHHIPTMTEQVTALTSIKEELEATGYHQRQVSVQGRRRRRAVLQYTARFDNLKQVHATVLNMAQTVEDTRTRLKAELKAQVENQPPPPSSVQLLAVWTKEQEDAECRQLREMMDEVKALEAQTKLKIAAMHELMQERCLRIRRQHQEKAEQPPSSKLPEDFPFQFVSDIQFQRFELRTRAEAEENMVAGEEDEDMGGSEEINNMGGKEDADEQMEHEDEDEVMSESGSVTVTEVDEAEEEEKEGMAGSENDEGGEKIVFAGASAESNMESEDEQQDKASEAEASTPQSSNDSIPLGQP